jgi:hypothetical protein
MWISFDRQDTRSPEIERLASSTVGRQIAKRVKRRTHRGPQIFSLDQRPMIATGQMVNPVAVVGGSLVTVTGNASTGWTATGNGTANGGAGGNPSISSETTILPKITCDYGSGSALFGTTQSTLLANITFSLTPEVHPALVGIGLCGILLFSRLWHEHQLSRRSKSVSSIASGRTVLPIRFQPVILWFTCQARDR